TWYETTPVDKWKFTSYERDSGTGETGLDYANFRYYASGQGRFMSADLVGGNIRVPQTLNRYSYVLNDPVNANDPLGLCVPIPETGECDDGGGGQTGGGNGLLHPPLQDGSSDRGGGGGPIRKKAKGRIKDKCLDFILNAIKNAFNAKNDAAASRGQINVDVLQAQKDVTSATAFIGAMMGRTIVTSKTPSTAEPRAEASASGNTITLYPLFASASDPGEIMIHETFHGDPYDFSDRDMADALGAKYKVVPNDPQATEGNASDAWDKKLQEKCGAKQ
ncbi:MAG TPA: RHS repeat-associated core domain-containing protein, partial [Candidatus Elarobacter sp.]|nr:RHS repeat-associated core domain-containing protein [Candidatus Elarobacter sp.]